MYVEIFCVAMEDLDVCGNIQICAEKFGYILTCVEIRGRMLKHIEICPEKEVS